MAPSYTEEEFKKLLKNLFAEKKRVQDLQKQIEQVETQETEQLRTQLEKVKPAIKKLVDELKEARQEVEALKRQEQEEGPKEEELKGQVALLTQRLAEAEDRQRSAVDDEALSLRHEMLRLEEALEAKDEEIQKEVQRFENERQRLVERMAETLSQSQRQGESASEQREENNSLRRELELLEEDRRRTEDLVHELKSKLSKSALESTHVSVAFEKQLEEEKREKEEVHTKLAQVRLHMEQERRLWAEKSAFHDSLQAELAKVAKKLEEAEAQLAGSGIAAVRQEWETKLENYRIESEKAAAEKQEEIIANSYAKMKELHEKKTDLERLLEEKERQCKTVEQSLQDLKGQLEEKNGEIRKAQQHLAKKVKETTILRDLVERQKTQIMESQSSLTHYKAETERLQNSLSLQRIHDEKVQMAAKEWQEKYRSSQEEASDLHRVKKNYEQALLNVKSILVKTLDPAKESRARPSIEDELFEI